MLVAMYARRLKCRNPKWYFVFKLSPGLTGSSGGRCIHSHNVANSSWGQRSKDKLVKKYKEGASLGPSSFFRDCTSRFNGRCTALFTVSYSRFYSSKGDESNASEGKHMPVKDSTHTDKGKPRRKKTGMSLNHCDDHVRLGEHNQLEWLYSEKLSLESKRKESPFITRRQRLKNEFFEKTYSMREHNVSWDTFPYYMHEHTRNTLLECVSSHLKHKKFTASYGGSLASSYGRILLQSFPGMELYLERLVRALAGKLQVPLLVLDGSVLAPHGFGEIKAQACFGE